MSKGGNIQEDLKTTQTHMADGLTFIIVSFIFSCAVCVLGRGKFDKISNRMSGDEFHTHNSHTFLIKLLKNSTLYCKEECQMSQQFLKVGVDHVEYREEESGVWVCLSDIVYKIIESKKPKDYMYKIKNKRSINNKLYITLDQTKEILEKSKKSKTRPLYAELCKLQPCGKIVEDNDDKEHSEIEEDEPLKDLETLKEIYDDTRSFPEELKDTFLDIQNNYFKYKGKDVFIVVVNGVAWFKGIDVANLFDFSNASVTVNQRVSQHDRKPFSDLGVNFKLTPKPDPQTVFINLEGVYDLIMSSRKPEAKVFRRWLSHQVLPALNKFGSFSLGKKFGSFYDTADLFEYQNQNVFYVAYIGVHRNEPLFKFGISFDYYRREFHEHKKIYSTFDLLYLRRTDNNRTVEELFKKECQIKELYRKLEIQGKQYTEMFTVNEKNGFDRMRVILDKIIEQYPTKEIQARDEKIKTLENKIEVLEATNAEKEKLVEELKKDKSWLQGMIEAFRRNFQTE